MRNKIIFISNTQVNTENQLSTDVWQIVKEWQELWSQEITEATHTSLEVTGHIMSMLMHQGHESQTTSSHRQRTNNEFP